MKYKRINKVKKNKNIANHIKTSYPGTWLIGSSLDRCKETACFWMHGRQLSGSISIYGARNYNIRQKQAKRIAKILSIIYNKMKLSKKSLFIKVAKDTNAIEIGLHKLFFKNRVAGHFILTAIRFAKRISFKTRNINNWNDFHSLYKTKKGRDVNHLVNGNFAVQGVLKRKPGFKVKDSGFGNAYRGIVDYSVRNRYRGYSVSA